MGINGLLRTLSPLLIPENEQGMGSSDQRRRKSRNTHSSMRRMHNIRQFKDKTVAIDASSWLYKASYATAERLVEAIEEGRRDSDCERILCRYMLRRCEELLAHASIRRIYLVFDGKRCPMKAVTNLERDKKRRANLEEARRLKRLGMKAESEDKYKTCLKVVPWMAESVAKAVHQKWGKNNKAKFTSFATEPRVKCMFSPYEADAQLAKLCVDGVVDAVVTEDSDVLVYSAACNKSFPIIYKLDRNNGECDVISMDWLLGGPNTLTKSRTSYDEGLPSIRRNLLEPESSSKQTEKGKSSTKSKSKMGGAMLSHLRALSSREGRKKGCGARMFVQACVLAGCDYAPSQLSGVGIVSAFKMIKENAHRDTKSRFLHTLKSFPKDKFFVPDEDESLSLQRDDVASMVEKYEELLAQSESIFYYHRVLDLHGKVVPLVDMEKNGSIDFLPCLARFEDESFIGNLDVGMTRNEKAIAKVGQSTTQSTHTRLSNPHRNIRHNNALKSGTSSRNPYALKRKTPTNLFSFYAHNEGSNSSRKKTPMKSTSKFESMSKAGSVPREEIALDESESSDDEIEEASSFSRSLQQMKASDGRSARSQQDDIGSSSSDDEIEEASPFFRSLPQSNISNRNGVKPPIDESDEEIEEASPFTTSTPKIKISNRNGMVPPINESDEEIEEASPFTTSTPKMKISNPNGMTPPINESDQEIEESSPFATFTPKTTISECDNTPQCGVEPFSSLSSISNQEQNNDVQVQRVFTSTSKYFSKSDPICETPVSINCNTADELSDDIHVVVTPPQSQQNGNILFPPTNNSDDDDDDDDCIIIEESSTTFKSPTPIRLTRPSTKPPEMKTRWQGGGRKRTRFTGATKKDKGLGRTTKRTRSTSIRSFFQPVTNS